MKRYKITCLDCGAEREIAIHKSPMGDRVDWLDDNPSEKIISARQRLDSNWGFQCLCGANDIVTDQERQTFSNVAAPKPKEINEIVKNLIVQEPKFRMVGA